MLDSEHLSSLLPAGYYDNVDISTTLNPIGKVTYTVSHTHGSYCYPVPEMVNGKARSPEGTERLDNGVTITMVYHYYDVECSICGKKFTGNGGSRSRNSGGYEQSRMNNAKALAEKAFNKHLVDGRCPNTDESMRTCGKDEGERIVTDVTTLQEGDSVVSATIDYSNENKTP